MKIKWILWSAFFGVQPMIAQTSSLLDPQMVTPMKKSDSIPCFAQCANLDTMQRARKVLCCSDWLQSVTIEQIQTALNGHGYLLKVDGRFGKKTKKAFIAFQQKKGLPTDSTLQLFQELGILTVIDE